MLITQRQCIVANIDFGAIPTEAACSHKANLVWETRHASCGAKYFKLIRKGEITKGHIP